MLEAVSVSVISCPGVSNVKILCLKITCDMDQDLTIEAHGSVLLRGSEGVTFDGKTVSISSGDHVNLTTVSLKE